MQDEGKFRLVGLFAFGGIELGLRLKQERNAFAGLAFVIFAAYPAVEELLFGVLQQSCARVGHIDFPAPYLIDDHEMVLPPMHDAGQRGFVFQLLERQVYAQGLEADFLSRRADTQ